MFRFGWLLINPLGAWVALPQISFSICMSVMNRLGLRNAAFEMITYETGATKVRTR
jgi:hypothetical protein